MRFCPRCAASAHVWFPRMLRCDSCGYRAMFGPDPVAAAIPRDDDGRIWLLRRSMHEGAGLWTFPGGYVELGESIEDGAPCEMREASEVRAFAPADLPWDELAFWSTERALLDVLA